MIEITRKEFKVDEVWKKLYEAIVKHHKVADHTGKVLIQNRNVKDFCEEARHYIELPGKTPIYLHYDVSSWFKQPMGVQVKIESIGVYDDYLEWNTSRVKHLHSANAKHIPNIN